MGDLIDMRNHFTKMTEANGINRQLESAKAILQEQGQKSMQQLIREAKSEASHWDRDND